MYDEARKRIRFDDVEAIHDDVQTTNDGAYRIEANNNGGWDVYVTETGEKIVDDSSSWHFDVVFAIERHLNGEAAAGQWRGPGPRLDEEDLVDDAIRNLRRNLRDDEIAAQREP